jgi:hypothetical protein
MIQYCRLKPAAQVEVRMIGQIDDGFATVNHACRIVDFKRFFVHIQLVRYSDANLSRKAFVAVVTDELKRYRGLFRGIASSNNRPWAMAEPAQSAV